MGQLWAQQHINYTQQMLCDLETVALTKTGGWAGDVKIFSGSDQNRNECNRGTTQATQKGREAKPRWCGYVQKRRSGYTGQRRDGASRQEGKTTKQVHGCSDGHGVTEEDDRNTYRQIICFSDLCRSGHSIKNGKLEWNTFLLNVFKKKKKGEIILFLLWADSFVILLL